MVKIRIQAETPAAGFTTRANSDAAKAGSRQKAGAEASTEDLAGTVPAGEAPKFLDKFYGELAQKAFLGNQPVTREALEKAVGTARTEQMLAATDDPGLRAMLSNASASATPREVLGDWAGRAGTALRSLGWSEREAETHFRDKLQAGVRLVEEARSAPVAITFGGKEISAARGDLLPELSRFSPELALLSAASQQSLVGPAEMRAAVERADLPADVREVVLSALAPAAADAKGAADALVKSEKPDPIFTRTWSGPSGEITAPLIADILKNGDKKHIQALMATLLVEPPVVSEKLRREAIEAFASSDTIATIVAVADQGRFLSLIADPARRAEAAGKLALEPSDVALGDVRLNNQERQALVQALVDRAAPEKLPELIPLLNEPAAREQALTRTGGRIADLGAVTALLPEARAIVTAAALPMPEALQNVIPGGDASPYTALARALSEPVTAQELFADLNALGTAIKDKYVAEETPKFDEDLQKLASSGRSIESLGFMEKRRTKKALEADGSTAALALRFHENWIGAEELTERFVQALEASADQPADVSGIVWALSTLVSLNHSEVVAQVLPRVLDTALAKALEQGPGAALALVAIGRAIGGDAGTLDKQLQKLLKSPWMGALLPYSGIEPQEALQLIKQRALPRPVAATLVQRLEMPTGLLAEALEQIGMANRWGETLDPRDAGLLLGLAAERKLPIARLASLAQPLLASGLALDRMMVLRFFAENGGDASVGASLLADAKPNLHGADLANFYAKAGAYAAEGRLFDPNALLTSFLAEDGVDKDPLAGVLTAWASKPGSVLEAASPDQREEALGKLLGNDAIDPLALVSAYVRLGAKAPATSDLLGEVVRCASKPLRSVDLGAMLQKVSELTGQPVSTAVRGLLTPDGAKGAMSEKALVNKDLEPLLSRYSIAEIAMSMLRVMALAPEVEPDGVKKLVEFLSWSGADAAFTGNAIAPLLELAGSKHVGGETLEQALELALSWSGKLAARQDGQACAFWALDYADQILGRRPDASASRQALARVVSKVMREPGSPWTASERAQVLLRRNEVDARREELRELARSDDPRAGCEKLVAKLVAEQPSTASLILAPLLEALRAEQMLVQPTLVEAAAFASRTEKGAAATPAAPDGERVTVCGREISLFQGEKLDGEIPRRRQMIEVPAFEHVFGVVAEAVEKDRPTIILGPSGAAKTAAVEHYAAESETPLLRLNGHPKARVEEFFGEWKLDKEGKPYFEPAQFLERWVNGGLINVDEFNVYPEAIQNVLAELARSYGRGEDKVSLRIGGHLVEVKRNEHTRLVMTANPDYSGVNPVSPELNEACDLVPVPGIPPEQLVQIVGKSFPDVPQELLLKACQLQWQLDALAATGGFEGQYHFSIRNLLRAAKRFHAHANPDVDAEKLMARECREIYYDGLVTEADRAKVAEVFGGIAAKGKKGATAAVFSVGVDETRPAAEDYQQVIGPDSVSFFDATLPRGPNRPVPLEQLKLRVGNRQVPVAQTPRLKEQIYAVFKAWQNGEAICLKGPRDCGSSVALEAALAMTGWPSTTKDFNSGTDIGLLLGDTTVENKDGVVSTAFVPGLLTTSAEKGGGFVARNMNRAKASVLARLHPVFEEVRSFTLQNGDRVEVSPNFYFASTLRMDAGELEDGLSPAMSNRMTHRFDSAMTVEERRELMRTVAGGWGMPTEIADAMVDFESAYRELVFERRVISGEVGESNLPSPNFERMLRWLGDVADEFKKTPTEAGLREAFIDRAMRHYSVYGDEDQAKIAELARAIADGDVKAEEALLGHKLAAA